jgi:hypothetical protein|uniref:Uncharacterized protein n=1 Tax=Picea glauca TaxID=3330 RepID=A0A101LY04_PICGL|nr:hypothetical protein ABT39_MTgene5585 [Picea glauca]QHR89585.1 hypothetical protein Q903MT_gene3607 [Picea sitchensis]
MELITLICMGQGGKRKLLLQLDGRARVSSPVLPTFLSPIGASDPVFALFRP